MAVKCNTCITLKRLNNDLITQQKEILQEFKNFVIETGKTNEMVLENLEGATSALSRLLTSMD